MVKPSLRSDMGKFYEDLVKRQMYFHGALKNPNLRFLSKNPAFVNKMKMLIAQFPGCKFVYLIRTPYNTLPSIADPIRDAHLGIGVDAKTSEKCIKKMSEGIMNDYIYGLEIIDQLSVDSPTSASIVRYTDLSANVEKTISDCYEGLNFEVSKSYSETLRDIREKAAAREFKSEHEYKFEDCEVSKSTLEERLGKAVFERFGFDLPK